jgi:hypothetical protein
MPRFVVLEHDHPTLHWDLMIEHGAALKTWRLAVPPEKKGEPIEALPLGDHRLTYLDYEGPVSGDRGNVKKWDEGSYSDLGVREGQALHVLLEGKRLHGVAVLERHRAEWFFRIDEETMPG